MLGTVEEPMEKVLSSDVVDSDLFDAEMEDGSDTESRDQKLINAIKSGNSTKDELISSSAKDGEADDDSSDDEVIRPIRRKSRSPGSKENHQNEDHNSPVRRKTKPHMILDSDEDSEDDGNGQSERLVPENNESEPKGMNSDNDNDNDEEHRSSKHGLSSAKKKNRSIIESDDDDDGHDVINGDVFDDEMECSESTKRNSVLESDEDNNDSDSEQQKSDGLGDAENEEDEMCEGEEMVRAGKKKKSKKPSSLEPRRTKQAALEQIHSESQRLVRDAALNLPYHKPKPLTLDDFFKKKSIIQEIQPIRGHFKKPQAAIKSVNLAIQSKEEKKRAKDGKQKKEDDDPKPEMRETNTNTENTENKAEENVTDSGISTTPGKMDSKSQGRSSGKLKLLKKVASVTPRLSGNSDSFIDLDDSGISESKPSKKMKGIQELMSRFVKHTAKPKPKATQQVQLSVVQKETNETGKEELKCNTLTVTVDGDEDIDPKLKVPGAKLQKLKATLQAKMKVKREQERKKREEAYQLDNEEGFGDEIEEELTDQTDTDDEDIEDEGDDDMGIEGIEMEAEEADNESEEDEDNDNTDADTIDATESAKVKDNRNGESIKLKLDNSIRSDPSNSSSSFKTPAKANTSSSNTTHSDTQTPVAHISTETMNLFDSTSSLPGDGNESRKAQERNGTVEGFNFSAIKQKKGLIKHKSMDFGEYEDFLSDGDGDLVKFLENDQGEKDMKNTSLNSLDTSLDIGSTIPAYQPGGGTTGHHQEKSSIGRNSPDLFTPWKRGNNTCTSSLQKSTSKLSELTLPVEDSQDLFNSPPQLDISQHSSSQKQLSDAESQSFHFSLDNETQSQFLDEHGFLNVQSSSKPKTSKRQLKLSVESDTSQEGMDELLGLCSGKFAEDTQESNASSAKGSTASKGRSLFSRFSSDLGTSSQRSNIDELLGLCSGTFTENTQKKADGEDTDAHKDKDDNDDNESVASFHIMSDVEDKDEEEEITKKREKKMNRAIAFSDEEDDDGGIDDDGMEGDLEDELDEDEQADLVKKQRLLNKFIEDEAELSGSDVGSDDELEDAADDEYEEEAIEEELLPEEDLKNQINRIHMKTMEDEDARRLRLYQEMYLQDGDLWTDGKGRTRRFRWNNMDDDASEMDMFRKDSDGEVSDNETELELKWRKERYERERWLEEQRKEKKAEEEDVDVDENSQFTKIIKNIEKKKKVIPEETITMDTKEKTANTSTAKGAGTPKPVHQTMFRRGSFLCKSKEDLDKIAALTKPLSNPNGPKYSRNFVFQSRSPPKEDAMKKPQVRRSISVSGSASQPVSKRPRLDRSLSTETKHSIFNHF